MTPLRCAAVGIAAAILGALTGPTGAFATSTATPASAHAPTGRWFNGYNERFNLGQGGASGAVCEARRAFDDDLVAKGARVWDVSCRGWSRRLGRLYLFPGPRAAQAAAAWKADLGKRADCAAATGVLQTCKTKPDGLDYVVVTGDATGARAGGEGLAGIADVLGIGVKFLERRIGEPATVDEVNASLAQAAGNHVGEMSQAEQAETPDARLLDGYKRGEDWNFADAETRFTAVASLKEASTARRAEALYNAALNASNDGRFIQAKEDFAAADALAAQGGNGSVMNLALDYKAADLRNQRRYEEAVAVADKAIGAHMAMVQAAAVTPDGSGGLKIADQSAAADTGRLSAAQREALRAAQALQIKGTSLEAMGQRADAAAALAQARAILDRPISSSARQPRRLGEASPWLDVRVRADVARLAIGTPRASETLAAFRQSIDDFAITHPDSLPVASFRIELARTELLEATDAQGLDRPLSDYEAAFAIFRKQRGSLSASADLAQPYFDTLLRRIGDNPANDPKDVDRFFNAAQSLISQSSADAAKRQAAKARIGDAKVAGLARALEDTGRQYDAMLAERAEAVRGGSYQGLRATDIDAALAKLQKERDLLESQLLDADPKYASTLNNLVSLDALQKQLRPGEVYLKVFMLSERGYGLLISSNATKVYAFDLGRQQVADMLEKVRPKTREVRKRTVIEPFDVAKAHEAFLTVFGPVAPDILAAKHVIYEPDVTLIVVPFATYVVDDESVKMMKARTEEAKAQGKALTYDGVHWLGATVNSTIALSAPAFVQARKSIPSKGAGVFYGFGDPHVSNDPRAFAVDTARGEALRGEILRGGEEGEGFCSRIKESLARLPPLPDTADEVKLVAQSLGQGDGSYSLGNNFTDSDILRRGQEDGDLKTYRVLYFATHGIMSTEARGCIDTALLTSLGSGDSDELLDVDKIPNLHLDADMVVLSACDTGVSIGGNETLGGLVTSFVLAGARNLVVSNWHVDSHATEQLMTKMFSQKGDSQSDALATAERTLMNSKDRYSHPFYWAPFVIVGDGAQMMPGG